ncbi:intermembrane space AAA protease-like protein IAP-1 [Corynespora cassiicola Philippines]|uniref:Intermembrane space AAA protease-like protein IAP-1 n=1 Tax=Corynespora cassiicola Philippines TaxID=1448308 RepID=A0A2T2P862_CORCC|nr:intermembrane space AAA protease-like protein IAP-1 [Corynespora cassiicola Philippines]
MAFHAPIAVQNVVAATTELWPTMSTVLKSPWQGLARQSPALPAGKALLTPASPAPAAQLVLPGFLQSVPVSALRQPSSRATMNTAPSVSAMLSAVPHSALRLCNPITRSMPLNSFIARQYSTRTRMGPLKRAHPSIPSGQVGRIGLALSQQRSIFGGPSRNTLSRLEQAANNNPTSPSAQATFYSALLRANMPQIVVDRYRSNHFATNTAVDQCYRKALEKLGQTDVQAGQNVQGNLSSQQMQAIGQAVGAHVGGGQVGMARSGSGQKSDPLYVVVEESMMSSVFKWARWLLGFGLAAYVALILVTIFIETSGVLKKVGGGTSAEVRPEHQNTRFSDVQGCDEAKEELTDIVDFLKNPDRYNKLGGRLPKGVLLIGPPGTGKTLLARAVAGEAGVPFFYMSGSEFDEVYVGVGAKRVRELFSAARSKAPAIVFIDELDAVGGKRQSRDANYHRQTLNQLLNDLDGFDQSTGVIFIAATNHPEILDKALLRPGRFDRHVQVELPDVKGRLGILKHHTKKIRLSPDVDLSSIARGTPGFSGAELENLANSAAIQASKLQAKQVTVSHLEWAKDKIMMGSERKTRVVPLKDKLQTAYHEGGHTLVGLYTKGWNEVHKATILPRGHAAGITYFLPHEEHHRLRSQYIRDLQVSMGGKMAEEIVFGAENVGDGVSGDIQQATKMAYRMVTVCGFSDLLGNVDFSSNYEQVSPETKRLIDNEVRRLIDEAKDSAKTILQKHRKELDLLAQALVQYETLDKDEITKVIKGEKLKDRLMAMPDVPIHVPDVPVPPKVTPPVSGSNDSGPPSGSGLPA